MKTNIAGGLNVLRGDLIGLYFPNANPIPYEETACFTEADQLRYQYDPDSVMTSSSFQLKVISRRIYGVN